MAFHVAVIRHGMFSQTWAWPWAIGGALVFAAGLITAAPWAGWL